MAPLLLLWKRPCNTSMKNNTASANFVYEFSDAQAEVFCSLFWV